MYLPRISLVTPSFNQAAFLEQTLQSVLRQGYPDLQYGVVDGGSTDGSLDIIARYRDRLDFVIIEPDGGQSQAINKGLRLCYGDIVGWLNSDDTLEPGALGTVARHFAEHPRHDWIIGCCRQIDARGQTLGRLRPFGEFNLAGALLRRRGFDIPQPGSFWRRPLLDRVGLLDETLHHCMDFELWCRFLAAGYRPALLDATLATYRRHGESKSCAQPDSFIAALIQIERRYRRRLPRRERYQLSRAMGYQQRALALRTTPGRPWAALARRPWWLASADFRAALLARRAA